MENRVVQSAHYRCRLVCVLRYAIIQDMMNTWAYYSCVTATDCLFLVSFLISVMTFGLLIYVRMLKDFSQILISAYKIAY